MITALEDPFATLSPWDVVIDDVSGDARGATRRETSTDRGELIASSERTRILAS